jgi:hypothetical protein
VGEKVLMRYWRLLVDGKEGVERENGFRLNLKL